MVEGGLVVRWIKDEIHKLKNGGHEAEVGQSEKKEISRSGFDTGLRRRAAIAVTYPKRSTGST
ncbi:hypothetical protein E2C01_071484 [Portunus trituberculatus]|uniref:Uncharacterized protein n=1 Tax=Portunus trituberculatus TaxID=210409 RepID=A0A5B7I4K1_PORTR|nr:hypothetical protein [Portunus trituberculatus]